CHSKARWTRESNCTIGSRRRRWPRSWARTPASVEALHSRQSVGRMMAGRRTPITTGEATSGDSRMSGARAVVRLRGRRRGGRGRPAARRVRRAAGIKQKREKGAGCERERGKQGGGVGGGGRG